MCSLLLNKNRVLRRVIRFTPQVVKAAMAALLVCTGQAQALEIALSFDDAPLGNGPLYTGAERTNELIAKLARAGVGQAVFFANPDASNPGGLARLQAYAKAGHLIANHTATHPRIRAVGIKRFVEDIERADKLLRPLEGFVSWFRYPFLDEGKTFPERTRIREALSRLGYRNGYVTIDNSDWYMAHLIDKAIKSGRTIDREKFRRLYADTLWQCIEYYDKLAMKTLGRSPRHVLLLHENDAAALGLDALIATIKAHGGTIISPVKAYEDPIASEWPDTAYSNQGRIAAIARARGNGARLRHDSEDARYLDRLFERKGVFR